MKRITFLVLACVLLLPMLAAGCDYWVPQDNGSPTPNGGEGAVTIDLTCDDFTSQNHITKSVTLGKSGSLTVSLCANPSTGYQWEENATISMIAGGGQVIVQTSHSYVAGQANSEEMIVGAPGQDTWVFDPQNEGTSTIAFTYGRPWEGGEKDVWTLTVNVTVE